jgi:hypothetical protein
MEKCKYELCTRRNGYKYSFVTTTRNTEECINILLEKAYLLPDGYKSYKIYKTVNGIRELIVYGKGRTYFR